MSPCNRMSRWKPPRLQTRSPTWPTSTPCSRCSRRAWPTPWCRNSHQPAPTPTVCLLSPWTSPWMPAAVTPSTPATWTLLWLTLCPTPWILTPCRASSQPATCPPCRRQRQSTLTNPSRPCSKPRSSTTASQCGQWSQSDPTRGNCWTSPWTSWWGALAAVCLTSRWHSCRVVRLPKWRNC